MTVHLCNFEPVYAPEMNIAVMKQGQKKRDRRPLFQQDVSVMYMKERRADLGKNFHIVLGCVIIVLRLSLSVAHGWPVVGDGGIALPAAVVARAGSRVT